MMYTHTYRQTCRRKDHEPGLVLQPANLLITVGCRIKLIDFDTAKTCIGKFMKKEQHCYNSRTAMEFFDSQIAGTVPYLAPECVTYVGYGRAMDWCVHSLIISPQCQNVLI